MPTLFEDLRYAWRLLARAPGYAAIAILVLALGIGATTAMYGVLKAVVLNPLPFPDQHQLVRVRESKLPEYPQFSVAPGNYLAWRGEIPAFAAMSMFAGQAYNLTGRDEPARLRGVQATEEFFTILGVQPALGRAFGPADAAGDGEPVVLSHGAWMTYFGGAPSALGQAITMNDRSYTVIGVLPPKIDFPNATNELITLWRPTAEEAQQHGAHYAGVVARLAPGSTLDQARRQLDQVAARLEKANPNNNTGWRTVAKPLAEDMLGDARERLLLLVGGVGLVLLIACAKVASLTLVRATGRAQEFAVRRAQGATGLRIARQLVTEGVLLALIGGGLGLLLAGALLPVVRNAAPPGFPRIADIGVNGAVLAAAAVVSLIAGVAAALVPAALAGRRAVATDLRDSGRGLSSGRGSRTRAALVIGEVALAVVLLAGAGVLGRSLARLAAVQPGFNTASNAFTRMALAGSRYTEDAEAARFYAQLEERVAALPGVRAAGVVQSLPVAANYVLSFSIDGRPEPKDGEEPNTNYYSASPGYLPAMGIPLRRGRALNAADRRDSPPVAMVSESFVAKFFPGEEALGKRIRFGGNDDPWIEIVGLVGDVRQSGLDAEMEPQAYVAFDQTPFQSAFVVVDSSLPAGSQAASIREAVRSLDPNQPVGQVQSIAEMLGETLAARRFSTWLLALFAAAALLLSAIGLYGTIAYTVSQAQREIGVRLALGAQSRDVLAMVVGNGLLLAAAGAALGVLGALAAGRLIERYAFGVSARDPLTLVAIVAVMLVVSLLASGLPAWRATRIDPIVALRQE